MTYDTGTNRIATVGGAAVSYALPAPACPACACLPQAGQAGGDGWRVKKSNGIIHWRSLSGEILAETDLSGTNLREFVYFGGARIARREENGTTYYFFSDHLGTARVMTNATGQVQQESTYYPFGGEQRVITNTVANNYKFTGFERDSESGLDDTLFRKYAQNLGRWLSPDPIAGSIFNLQSLNRYGYVVNNPLNFVDPFGLDGESLAELPPPPPFAACHLQLWPGCVVIGSETVDLPPVGSSGSGSDPLGRMMHELSYYGGTPRRQGAPKRKEYFAELLDTTCRTPGCMGALKIAGDFASGAADVITGPVAVLASAFGVDPSYSENSLVDTESASYVTGTLVGTAVLTGITLEATQAPHFFNVKAGLHPAHHRFPEYGAKLPHFQVIWWRAGISGSHGHRYLPLTWWR